jgi:hypothetical protein
MRSNGRTALLGLFTASALFAAVGCGSTTPDSVDYQRPGEGSDGGKPAGSDTDLTIDLPKVELKGAAFGPEALVRPPMPVAEGRRKLTIDKQRQALAKAKDPQEREGQAQILATQLFQASKAESGGKEKPLLEEGRQVLRAAYTGAGESPDVNTIRMLGVYEIMLGDWAAAAPLWERLTVGNPQDKEVDHFRTWWINSLLLSGQNAAALAASQGVTPSLKSYELAYVIAWARWRAGDGAGAWQAMRAAAIGWPDKPKLKGSIIERDLVLFAGRTPVTVSEAATVTAAFAGAGSADQYAILFKLSQSMSAAGRYPDTIAAVDAALRAVGSDVPKQDPPKLRFSQAELTLRFDDPVSGARLGKQAIEAVVACGAACPDKADVISAVLRIATFYHSIYATSQDVRFFAPALEIYAAVSAASDPAKKEEVDKLSKQLEQTKKNVRAGGGVHDKEIVAALMGLHSQEVLACYEQTLSSVPKLSGTLTLDLEFDNRGGVTGATSTPPAGDAELAAVAKCALERGKTWRLPTRGKPGVTRVKLSYELSKIGA